MIARRPAAVLSLLAMPLLATCKSAPLDRSPAVIVVVLDGVRTEESLGDTLSSATGEYPWETLPTVWSELVPQGARATAAYNAGITITAPAHCVMTSGQRTAFGNYPNEEMRPGVYLPEVPSITGVLRSELGIPQQKVAVMGNTVLIQPVVGSRWPGAEDAEASFVLVRDPEQDGPARLDQDVLVELHALLDDKAPRFALVNLHSADRAGHTGEPELYPERVRSLDKGLVDLWAHISKSPSYANGYLILVADHGRHRGGDQDPPWAGHGDACMGCRHIPLLILGPGARAGSTTDETVLLTDLAPTIAGIMGVSFPWSTGRPLDEMFTIDLGATPSGPVSLAAAGGSLALEEALDDSEHRSQITVDGQALSSPGALSAEAPVMAADGERTWLCFRELVLDRAADEAPWLPRCFVRDAPDAPWSELPPPAESVSSFWRPALQVLPGAGLLAAWSDNTGGQVSASAHDQDIGLSLGTYSLAMAGWQVQQPIPRVSFPTGPTLHLDDNTVVTAIAASTNGAEAREHRQIFASLGQLGDSFSAPVPIDLSALHSGGSWRLERPALTQVDGRYWLAVLAHGEDGTRLALASSDGGQRWSDERLFQTPGTALPHISPRWIQGAVFFAAHIEGEASICVAETDGGMQCTPTGGAHIRDLSVDGSMAYAIVSDGEDWSVQHWPMETMLPQ